MVGTPPATPAKCAMWCSAISPRQKTALLRTTGDASFDAPETLRDVCPRVRELDLRANLIGDWAAVAAGSDVERPRVDVELIIRAHEEEEALTDLFE